MYQLDKDARKSIVGVTVTSFTLDDDREGATLEGIRDGQSVKFRLVVDADCCSNTWIESVIEESALVGHTITDIEDLELPDDSPVNGDRHTALGEDFYEDEMAFYGLAITTERGKCVIDYRNSSNGYYGGSMMLSEVAV